MKIITKIIIITVHPPKIMKVPSNPNVVYIINGVANTIQNIIKNKKNIQTETPLGGNISGKYLFFKLK
jgi:hypothetical protein